MATDIEIGMYLGQNEDVQIQNIFYNLKVVGNPKDL